MARYAYSRRYTWPVRIGCVNIGGDNPIAVQSMTNTSTMDTEGSARQIADIVKAGGEIVRLTAQGVREAENLTDIRDRAHSLGINAPLVADIHFNPKAAFAAASRVEKVRINPGNFVDPGRVFKKIEFTDSEYTEEIKKIDERLVPLLDICKAHGTALRIGVNHGSLSDRIMSRYGDTPEGMVESAMEFLRVCVANDFRDVVISIKASNVVVMTRTVRLMARAMDAEGMNFPLHLGVTEAGDGEDGRIKSAVGIGSLLLDGIGDTIRVSLSEDPACEIAPARAIIAHIASVAADPTPVPDGDDEATGRRESLWSDRLPQVEGLDFTAETLADKILAADLTVDDPDKILEALKSDPTAVIRLSAPTPAGALLMRSFMSRMRSRRLKNPVIIERDYTGLDAAGTAIAASIDIGSLLLAGYSDAIHIVNPAMTQEEINALSLNILQATRQRISKTEYISCPGCGRTLYDLQSTIRAIKEATSHLTGLKIGIMGCIVNGPGEMADADYGYVGAGPDRVSLYKNKECIVKNIPTAEAIPRLIELIKTNGDWKDPEEK